MRLPSGSDVCGLVSLFSGYFSSEVTVILLVFISWQICLQLGSQSTWQPFNPRFRQTRCVIVCVEYM